MEAEITIKLNVSTDNHRLIIDFIEETCMNLLKEPYEARKFPDEEGGKVHVNGISWSIQK